MRDAEAKLVFVFLQHFGEKSRLARPTGSAENKGRWARAAGHHSLDKNPGPGNIILMDQGFTLHEYLCGRLIVLFQRAGFKM